VRVFRIGHALQLPQSLRRALEEPRRPHARVASQAKVARGIVGAGLDDAVLSDRGGAWRRRGGPAAAAFNAAALDAAAALAAREASRPHVPGQRPAAAPNGDETARGGAGRGAGSVEAREGPQGQAAREHKRERLEPGPSAPSFFFLEEPGRRIGDDGSARDVLVELRGELGDGGGAGPAQVAGRDEEVVPEVLGGDLLIFCF